MSRWRPYARFLGLLSGLTVILISALIKAATASLLQGADGTPSGTTPPGFAIEPISLAIGIAAGGLAVGIPALARSMKHKKTQPTRDDLDQDCDGLAVEPRQRNKGWDGTIKGVKAVDEPGGSSGQARHKHKGWDGTVKHTTSVEPSRDGKLINPIAMDKELRADSAPEGSSVVKDKDKVKNGSGEGKKEFKGHVTLLK